MRQDKPKIYLVMNNKHFCQYFKITMCANILSKNNYNVNNDKVFLFYMYVCYALNLIIY